MGRRSRRDRFVDGLSRRGICGHIAPCGCPNVSVCCLACPLPRCRYEVPGGLPKLVNVHRDREIRRRRASGEVPAALATTFRLSPRQVFRILAAAA